MGENVQKKASGEKQVFMLQSIKMKVLFLVVGAILVSSAINLLLSIPMVRKSTSQLVKNYMNDLAGISGRNLDREIDLAGAGLALSPQELEILLSDVDVEGMDSSYCYVVNASGTMLYHPTAEKIGQPVENAAVKQLLEEMKAGNRPETDVLTYDFNGVNKYASFYIGKRMNFILVVTADEKEAFETANHMASRSLAGALASLAVCGLIGVLVAVRMTKPLVKITAEFIRLAELDFTDNKQLSAYTRKMDETGAMARAAMALQEKLSRVISNMQNQSRELYGASETMSRGTDEIDRSVKQVEKAVSEIAEGAASQAQETQTATENIMVMGSMITEASGQVENLSGIAQEMNLSGERAMNILTELNEINRQTKEAIGLIYDQTARTNRSVVEIKKATDIITNIAEETNLLSLNASIEAARAGEAGRGFAVVASQIQQLADQSNTSAGQINETISLLITEFAETMKIMEDVKQVIEKQDEDVANTEQAFGDVKDGISQSMEGIGRIAEMTEKLNAARATVVDIVQNLTAIAQENAAATEETSAAVTQVGSVMDEIAQNAAQLNQIANKLDSTVKQFKFRAL